MLYERSIDMRPRCIRFGVPLHAIVAVPFDRLDNAVGRLGSDAKAIRELVYRLMMT